MPSGARLPTGGVLGVGWSMGSREVFEEGAEAGLEEPGLLRASGGRVRWIVSSLGSRREGEREGGRENTGESQRLSITKRPGSILVKGRENK